MMFFLSVTLMLIDWIFDLIDGYTSPSYAR